jgi:hypothetical protein
MICNIKFFPGSRTESQRNTRPISIENSILADFRKLKKQKEYFFVAFWVSGHESILNFSYILLESFQQKPQHRWLKNHHATKIIKRRGKRAELRDP